MVKDDYDKCVVQNKLFRETAVQQVIRLLGYPESPVEWGFQNISCTNLYTQSLLITIGNFSYMLAVAVKKYFIIVDGVIANNVMEYDLIGGRLYEDFRIRV